MQTLTAAQLILVPCIGFICYYTILFFIDGALRRQKKDKAN